MDFSLLKNSQIRKIAPQVCTSTFVVFGSILMLSACAVVSQNECVVSNWHEQGVIVGTAGLSEYEARRSFESCGVAKPVSDRNAYITGYHEGLDAYCTEANGFQIGVEGFLYQDVCPEDVEESFLIGYRAGSELFLADNDLRAAKIAFASTAAPSTFIGTAPSAEHNRFKLETFPQTRDSARALVSQMQWHRLSPTTGEANRRSIGKRDLTSVTERCEAAKERAQEQGFVVDDAC